MAILFPVKREMAILFFVEHDLDPPFTTLIFVTIKDLKYYLQPDPAYLFNSVAGCCVSHHGV